MSSSSAIGLVSESLRHLLETRMRKTTGTTATSGTKETNEKNKGSGITVKILAPDESDASLPRINLFLYQIRENPTFKNMDWQLKPGSATELVPPPLSLDLFYLMTPYAANDEATGNANAHQILGEAMRVFHENPIVPEDCLQKVGLEDSHEQIKIMQNPLDMEELARIWGTFTQPFRLSVLYQVSVVQIDAAREKSLPTRVKETAIPEVRAPFHPPVVAEMKPINGPAGTEVTFRGQHLAGWKANVRVTGKTFPKDPISLTQDEFKVTLPKKLLPGFHELRVDISHLFRKTFFFEVI